MIDDRGIFEAIDEESMNAGSIFVLEKRLVRSGRKWSTTQHFLSAINPYGPYIPIKKRVRLDQLVEDSEVGFPVYRVDVNDTSFFIHGINHGGPGYYSNRGVRNYIHTRVASFMNSHEGEEFLFEEGIGQFFGLDESQELKDVLNLSRRQENYKATERNPSGLLQKLRLKLVLWAEGKERKTLSGEIQRERLRRRFMSPQEYFLVLERQALSEVSSIGKVSEYFRIINLPEPLNLEFCYVQSSILERDEKYVPHSLAEVIIGGFFGVPSAVERSLWTARELLKIAETKKLRKVHYLCGAFHESQVAFFLKHPGYTFSHLDEHIKSHG